MDRMERLTRYAGIFLGVFALFAALRITQGVTAPLAVAFVVGVILSPLSDRTDRLGLPHVVGALLSLFVTLLVIGMIAASAQPLIAQLLDAAPRIWIDVQNAVQMFQRMVAGFSQMSEGLSDALSPPADAFSSDSGGDGGGGEEEEGLESMVPTMADALLYAPSVAGQVLIFIGGLFFFLLTRVDIYNWAARRLAIPEERAELAMRLQRAEKLVARYFLTITVINFCEGALVALLLHVIGMPGAILWGFAAFLLNYLLYIGPAILAVSLIFGGFAVFSDWHAFLPLAAYLLVNTMEGQFVTPSLIGRHTAVNPLLVFLALVFGMWLWGPVGGIVAIPLLLWVLKLNDGRPVAQAPRS
ncbi:AI-2E family transporter [Falsirhodobacter deserti]|uniref:AI-2E family transporter n=1 Tax=Falsirhodobacter deserti TaxID=1365611 RepID=UPI0013E3758C|nr:AI-2E family transporter [Falsirhodobacter deserti]